MRRFFIQIPVFLFVSAALFSIEPNNAYQEERCYVDQQNILLSEKGIFVNFNGTFVPVETLAADDMGIYCEKFKAGFLMMCPYGHVYELGVQRAICPHYQYR